MRSGRPAESLRPLCALPLLDRKHMGHLGRHQTSSEPRCKAEALGPERKVLGPPSEAHGLRGPAHFGILIYFHFSLLLLCLFVCLFVCLFIYVLTYLFTYVITYSLNDLFTFLMRCARAHTHTHKHTQDLVFLSFNESSMAHGASHLSDVSAPHCRPQ